MTLPYGDSRDTLNICFILMLTASIPSFVALFLYTLVCFFCFFPSFLVYVT